MNIYMNYRDDSMPSAMDMYNNLNKSILNIPINFMVVKQRSDRNWKMKSSLRVRRLCRELGCLKETVQAIKQLIMFNSYSDNLKLKIATTWKEELELTEAGLFLKKTDKLLVQFPIFQRRIDKKPVPKTMKTLRYVDEAMGGTPRNPSPMKGPSMKSMRSSQNSPTKRSGYNPTSQASIGSGTSITDKNRLLVRTKRNELASVATLQMIKDMHMKGTTAPDIAAFNIKDDYMKVYMNDLLIQNNCIHY